MKLTNEQLAALMVQIANEKFGSEVFHRRHLLTATEQVVKDRGLWEADDDGWSSSVDAKSNGLANIDYRFSHQLAAPGLITKVRHGYWRLSNPEPPKPKAFTQPACDVQEPPEKIITQVIRIVRDTKTAATLKERYDFKCQVCGEQIQITDNSFYIEVHHVRPLGGKHLGFDVVENMLVLCPNHHTMFDFGVPRFIDALHIVIHGKTYTLTCKHELAVASVDYHNKIIASQ
ncbi:MAG TPA: HNH endonuclease [Verrucomicrobiae bacterium]|jgi:hypothetical protein